MPRKPSTPKYSLHKPTGQARVRLGGNDVYLGKYDSPESHEKYRRVVAEYLANPSAPAPSSRPAAGRRKALSVNELILAFFTWAEGYYRKNGEPTSELGIIRTTLRPLKELFGTTPAAEFGPLRLKAVRERFVSIGYSRSECNRRTRIITRMYRWAVEHEMVPGSILVELRAVAGLAKGRTVAPDYPPVECVPEADYLAALPHLSIPSRALVEFMALTGCRPGEACSMRPVDIDRTGPVWIYKPDGHKTEHHERDRVVLIGPRAQAILAPYLEHRKPEAAVFDPRELDGPAAGVPLLRRGNKRLDCKGRVIRSASYFSLLYLERAVASACRAAAVPTWTPNRLRHGVATRIQAEYSLDAARAVLGHSDARMTTRYAVRDLNMAAEIMKAIG